MLCFTWNVTIRARCYRTFICDIGVASYELYFLLSGVAIPSSKKLLYNRLCYIPSDLTLRHLSNIFEISS